MRRRNRHLFGSNLRSLFGWRDARTDVLEEMALHVDLRAAELEARGLTPDDARARARREVGAASVVVPQVARTAARTDLASSWRQRVDEGVQDTVYGVRVLRRNVGLTMVAVLTIALALGANAAMFATVKTLFFTPLPFDPDGRLVRVREFRRNQDGTRIQGDASRVTADAIAERPDLFAASVPMVGMGRALLLPDAALHLQATRVGRRLTGVLAVSPILGRAFTASEEHAGEDARVALISHRLWKSVFAGSNDVIGRTIRLDDTVLEIVGVLPARFHVPYDSDVWIPSVFDERQRSVFLLARLADGMTLEQVNAALEPLGGRLNQEHPEVLRGLGVNAVRARDYFIGTDNRVPLALMAAVGFLLLIGCANVALLLTARFASRSREVAVRAALGCGRARQIRQFVTEALLLFVGGGIFGLILATWLQDAFAIFLPEAFATQVGIDGIPIDTIVVGCTLVVSAATGLCFGLISAARATHADLHGIMKDGARSSGTASRGTLHLLAGAEIALAVVLLTAAAMMTSTFYRLQRMDLGFVPEGVFTARAGIQNERYDTAAARLAFIEQILERAQVLPEVTNAAISTVNPLCCGNWGIRMTPEGHASVNAAEIFAVEHQLVTPGFFETLQIPIVEGRSFSDADVAGREPVAIVDERTAARFWPGESAVGKRVKRGTLADPYLWMTVVGVARTIESESEYPESWYLPYAQHALGPSSTSLHLLVRTTGEPFALAAPIRSITASLDPALPLYGMTTMDDLRSEDLRQNRLGAVVVGAFALAGMLLAMLGMYGVLSFALAADTRAVGVRLALGARRSAVAAVVIWRAIRLTCGGLVGGTAAALVVAGSLERVVPGSQVDLRVIGASAIALLLAALLAAMLPARRAWRVDPVEALRAER